MCSNSVIKLMQLFLLVGSIYRSNSFWIFTTTSRNVRPPIIRGPRHLVVSQGNTKHAAFSSSALRSPQENIPRATKNSINLEELSSSNSTSSKNRRRRIVQTFQSTLSTGISMFNRNKKYLNPDEIKYNIDNWQNDTMKRMKDLKTEAIDIAQEKVHLKKQSLINVTMELYQGVFEGQEDFLTRNGRFNVTALEQFGRSMTPLLINRINYLKKISFTPIASSTNVCTVILGIFCKVIYVTISQLFRLRTYRLGFNHTVSTFNNICAWTSCKNAIPSTFVSMSLLASSAWYIQGNSVDFQSVAKLTKIIPAVKMADYNEIIASLRPTSFMEIDPRATITTFDWSTLLTSLCQKINHLNLKGFLMVNMLVLFALRTVAETLHSRKKKQQVRNKPFVNN